MTVAVSLCQKGASIIRIASRTDKEMIRIDHFTFGSRDPKGTRKLSAEQTGSRLGWTSVL